MDMKFVTAREINGHRVEAGPGTGDYEVWVKRTVADPNGNGFWIPQPDAFGPMEWTLIGWVTRAGRGKHTFLKVGADAWGPHRPTKDQAVLAVIF